SICVVDNRETNSSTIPTWNLIGELESHRGLYTVVELAGVLRKSACTVYRMAQKKQIPSVIIGGSRMFDPATRKSHALTQRLSCSAPIDCFCRRASTTSSIFSSSRLS